MSPRSTPSPQQKLVVFTEHRDTPRYLQERITTVLGRETSVVVIRGSIGREDRLAAQEAFRHDPASTGAPRDRRRRRGHQPGSAPT